MKFFLPLIVIFLFFSGCNDDKDKTTQKNILSINDVEVPKDVSKFVLTKINGENFTLHVKEGKGFEFEGAKNKIVLMMFFTTWCPPCIGEIPSLNALENKYKDNLQIIGIILEDDKNKNEIINFVNQNNIDFILTNSVQNFHLAKHIGGITSIPYMLLYDKNGNYVKDYKGAIPEEMLEVDIKKLM
jgi:thiol-disulfide isomerase/thioredoxin